MTDKAKCPFCGKIENEDDMLWCDWCGKDCCDECLKKIRADEDSLPDSICPDCFDQMEVSE